MKNVHTVDVKSSKFGKCKLTFHGPRYKEDTNVYAYCNKDPAQVIRVWFYPPTRRWACEIQNKITRTYESFGVEMLDGTYSFQTARQAWQFAATRAWH